MPDPRLEDCTDDAVALVRDWVRASSGVRPDPGAARLAGVLRDVSGLEFTLGFVDRVIRPEDPRVAAAALERLSQDVPEPLAWYLRGAVTVGGGFAQMLPWAIVPSARRILRRMTGHLVVDATAAKLGSALVRAAGRGTTADLDVTLLGTAVLGWTESDRRLLGAMELLARTDVHRVTTTVRAAVPQRSLWAFDETVRVAVERLEPLFRAAAGSSGSGPKTVTLEVEGHDDIDLTVAVFRTLLDRPEFLGLSAGIVVPAALLDAERALDELTAWALGRRARGGAPITVRIVPGSHRATERVDALLEDRPAPTWDTRREVDAATLRLLDRALEPAHTDAVRVGVSGQDLFVLAAAWTLAARRGVTDAVEVEMLLGMTATHLEAVRATVGRVVLATPVVRPDEFAGAVGYLVRRLQEQADPDGPMALAFDIDTDAAVFERARVRFVSAVGLAAEDVGAAGAAGAAGGAGAAGAGSDAALVPVPVPGAHDRTVPLGDPVIRDGFRNAPRTDPTSRANRAWAADIRRRVPESPLGKQTIRSARVVDRGRLERIMAQTRQAGVNWGRQDPEVRAELLDLIGHEIEDRRADLVEVIAAESGATVAEADAEVSEAVDHAHHAADRARHLRDVTGAVFVPPRLTVVVPAWDRPLSNPASGVLAALAAGSAVVLKPAPLGKRTGAVFADVLWDAGVPHSLLALVDLDVDQLGRDLVAHPSVDRILHTGSADTARSFKWWRAGLPLEAQTGGENAVVVTPSADLDTAVQDVVASAFGRAGQQRAAAALVVLVGSVGQSDRFRRQLVDAVRTLRVAWPDDPAAAMGPLVEEPRAVLRGGLSELEHGETWLVRPQPLDDTGRLWSPGVRDGVHPGGAFHQTTYRGPVIGIMHAETLDDALRIQNGTDAGLTAGLQSLDVDEVRVWLDRVEAGTVVVNGPIVDQVVGRRPLGGWKRSSIGTATRPGSTMSVASLGDFTRSARTPHRSIRLEGLSKRVSSIIEASRPSLSFEEFDQVRAGALSDVAARAAEFGAPQDPAGFVVERNVLRWRPRSVIVRRAEGVATADLVRVLVAATAARAHVLVSSAVPLPAELVQLFTGPRSPLDVVDHLVESDEEWLARVASGAVFREQWSTGEPEVQDDLAAVLSPTYEPRPHTAFGGPGARIRLLGGDAVALEDALGASADVAIHDGPVVESGLVEMLPFLQEQSVRITAHRFGVPDRLFGAMPL